MDSMQESYERDQADFRKCRDLRQALETFTAAPPQRAAGSSKRLMLEMAGDLAKDLKAIEDQIVAVWN